jgi:hypothetical protein
MATTDADRTVKPAAQSLRPKETQRSPGAITVGLSLFTPVERKRNMSISIGTSCAIHGLAHQLEESARWRREEAAQFPDDDRNAVAADMMEAIAKELRVGVDNSEAVLHGKIIERLWESVSTREFLAMEKVNEYFARIGFDHAPENATGFLADVVRLLQELVPITHETPLTTRGANPYHRRSE